MKMIRMLKVMAGPEGVSPIGKTMTVDDETAAQLVADGAAEVIATIETVSVDPVIETDTVDPVVEEAAPSKAKKKAA